MPGGLIQILFGSQAGQLCIILAHFIVHRFHHILGGNNPYDLPTLIQNRQRILGIVLNLLNAIGYFFIREKIRIRINDQSVQRIVLPGDDQVLQIDGTAEFAAFVHHIQGGNIVVLPRLTDQLMHGRTNIQRFRNTDIIGGDQAADSVLIVGGNQLQIRPHMLVQIRAQLLLVGLV